MARGQSPLGEIFLSLEDFFLCSNLQNFTKALFGRDKKKKKSGAVKVGSTF